LRYSREVVTIPSVRPLILGLLGLAVFLGGVLVIVWDIADANRDAQAKMGALQRATPALPDDGAVYYQVYGDMSPSLTGAGLGLAAVGVILSCGALCSRLRNAK
jgi:hypothetical protein